MTTYQSQAIWELCRQGYPIQADEAELRWRSGGAYHPDPYMKISRTLLVLINQCNFEVSEEKAAHEPSPVKTAPI